MLASWCSLSSCWCVEEETPGSLSEEDFLIGLLHASSNIISDSAKQDVDEEGLPLGKDVAFGQEHLCCCCPPLGMLKGPRILDVCMGLDVLGNQPLPFRVELSHPVLRQQEEKAMVQELVYAC